MRPMAPPMAARSLGPVSQAPVAAPPAPQVPQAPPMVIRGPAEGILGRMPQAAPQAPQAVPQAPQDAAPTPAAAEKRRWHHRHHEKAQDAAATAAGAGASGGASASPASSSSASEDEAQAERNREWRQEDRQDEREEERQEESDQEETTDDQTQAASDEIAGEPTGPSVLAGMRVALNVHQGKLCILGACETPWGTIPIACNFGIDGDAGEDRPIDLNAPQAPALINALEKAERTLGVQAKKEVADLAVESLVTRARVGDQNAMAMLSEVKRCAAWLATALDALLDKGAVLP